MSTITIIAILIVGFILILAELLVIPGFGVAGILGLAALIAGAAAAYTELGPTWGIVVGVVSAVLTGLTLYIVPHTKAGKKLILTGSQRDAVAPPSRQDLIGKTGVVLTRLRPGGMARIDEEEVDVITEGEYVDAGQEVVVVAIEGVRIVVSQKSPEE